MCWSKRQFTRWKARKLSMNINQLTIGPFNGGCLLSPYSEPAYSTRTSFSAKYLSRFFIGNPCASSSLSLHAHTVSNGLKHWWAELLAYRRRRGSGTL